MTSGAAPWWQRRLNDTVMAAVQLTRRADPYVRPAFDATLRQPLQDAVQWLINAGRRDEHLGIAEESIRPGEAADAAAIADLLEAVTLPKYPPGAMLRAGNTKTYGVVRGEFTVHDGLPGHLRHGVFAQSRTYPAWVRLSGPGPSAPPDIRDNGILSIAVKLMGVPGRKLLDDEQHTQDFTALSAPMFTTPDVAANVQLQRHLAAGIPILYFLNPGYPGLLNAIMQALYARTHTSPLETPYWSCVPYLLGPDQAMKYRLTPTTDTRTAVGWNPPDDYLQQALIHTLHHTDAHFTFDVQLQTDPHRMPIENATVIWPEHLAPHQTVATLTIPQQTIDPAEQFHLADRLRYNPWHALEAHRPLGNQNRARRAIYQQLAQLRQNANGTTPHEPTAAEPGRTTR
ncbi:hypothetical protein CS0771_55080 [Catellatospora sp. IY07-71]|uniref:catalase family protein n=1 Tax=Catellatospora sp. IY07-71 TaxID=2728827 RepID=UPI001BB2F5B9|nr:catalase family protein [Catellatospora sp. IY07-71]BCJ75964.1 hypothetical protein CS0771_55080 [Catellatospora sp. IY07-71]